VKSVCSLSAVSYLPPLNSCWVFKTHSYTLSHTPGWVCSLLNLLLASGDVGQFDFAVFYLAYATLSPVSGPCLPVSLFLIVFLVFNVDLFFEFPFRPFASLNTAK